jgi:DNA-binding transcriptional LysR family regulator
MNKFMALLVFSKVVEHGGFTAAARNLRLSVSAVTKTMARLEDELGTQLFNRTTRRLRTTDYGQQFYERCVRILSDLEDAEADLREGNLSYAGRLRVVVPFSFGRITLVPELRGFFSRYPEISVELNFSDSAVDLIAEGYDVAVRTGEIKDSRLVSRVLTRGTQVTFAAPAYLETYGVPQTPAALRDHNCITGRFGADWSFRDLDHAPISVHVSGNCVVNRPRHLVAGAQGSRKRHGTVHFAQLCHCWHADLHRVSRPASPAGKGSCVHRLSGRRDDWPGFERKERIDFGIFGNILSSNWDFLPHFVDAVIPGHETRGGDQQCDWVISACLFTLWGAVGFRHSRKIVKQSFWPTG